MHGELHRINTAWMLRVGGGYDQTPTNDLNRDIRIADSNRYALSVGAHYQPRPYLGFDLGYTHLFATGDVPVTKTEAVGTGSTYQVNAEARGSANLVGAQLTWIMDSVEPVAIK